MKKTSLIIASIICCASICARAEENKLQATANVLSATALFLNALNGVQNNPNITLQPIQQGYMRTPCIGNNIQTFTNCIGVAVYPNGNIYAGEFMNGQRQGMGMLRVLAKGTPNNNNIASNIPSTYVGQFSGNKINGYGNWSTDDGQSFNGFYVNNILQRIIE